MEKRNGKVKKTPIQHAITPTNEAIIATTINPNKTVGCLKII